jgi:hypothetical protein
VLLEVLVFKEIISAGAMPVVIAVYPVTMPIKHMEDIAIEYFGIKRVNPSA